LSVESAGIVTGTVTYAWPPEAAIATDAAGEDDGVDVDETLTVPVLNHDARQPVASVAAMGVPANLNTSPAPPAPVEAMVAVTSLGTSVTGWAPLLVMVNVTFCVPPGNRGVVVAGMPAETVKAVAVPTVPEPVPVPVEVKYANAAPALPITATAATPAIIMFRRVVNIFFTLSP
jgi:hypothetical protein